MAPTRAREVFFPYVFGEGAIRLSLSDCKIDGVPTNDLWDEDRSECNLVRGNPWSSAELQFDVTHQPGGIELVELLPAKERRKPSVKLIGCAQCRKTYRKIRVEGVLDLPTQSGRITLVLNREDLVDAVEFEVHVIRCRSQEDEPRLASDAAARVTSSQLVMIRIDEPLHRQGPGLPIEWESFSKSPNNYRASHSHALFHLDTDGPVLYLNKDSDPDLQAILSEDAPKGRKASLRNVLFSAIAMPVWMSLIRTALAEVDAEGNIDHGWQRKVLNSVALVAEPGCAPDEALRRMINDLRDTSGGRSIDQRLPVIIAEMVQFRERAEQTTRVLL